MHPTNKTNSLLKVMKSFAKITSRKTLESGSRELIRPRPYLEFWVALQAPQYEKDKDRTNSTDEP